MKNLSVILEECANPIVYQKENLHTTRKSVLYNSYSKNRIYKEDLGHLKVYSNTASLSASEFSRRMETLSIKCDLTLLEKIGEFSLSEKQMKTFTGLSWENLLEIKDLTTLLHNSQSRSVIQALIVFF